MTWNHSFQRRVDLLRNVYLDKFLSVRGISSYNLILDGKKELRNRSVLHLNKVKLQFTESLVLCTPEFKFLGKSDDK